VGYGDQVPETSLGRFVAIVTCAVGIVLLGLLFSVVQNFLSLTAKARRSVSWLKQRQAEEDERRYAAATLQHWWKASDLSDNERVHLWLKKKRANRRTVLKKLESWDSREHIEAVEVKVDAIGELLAKLCAHMSSDAEEGLGADAYTQSARAGLAKVGAAPATRSTQSVIDLLRRPSRSSGSGRPGAAGELPPPAARGPGRRPAASPPKRRMSAVPKSASDNK